MNKNKIMSQVDAEQNVGTTNADLKTEQGLMQITLGSRAFGFIEGPLGYIVTENDFCHDVRSLSENIELRVRMPWECEGTDLPAFRVFTVEALRQIATPIPSYREWAHYWGIKRRVQSNYNDFLKSLLEVGIDARTMPKWGEEPAALALVNKPEKSQE